jgi:hypothetical protein
MKTLLATIALMLTFSANAMVVSERASLELQAVDAYSPLSSMALDSVLLNIDNRSETLVLSVDRIVLGFKIEALTYNRCGVRQINASTDEKMTVQVIDRTNSHCLEDLELAPITVEVFTKIDNDLFATDVFSAEKFIVAYESGIVEGAGGVARKVEINHQHVIDLRPIQALR